VTPLIDGMNLVAKEYLACQRDNPGLLILSEFAGAAEELFNAFLVNPYDARAVAEALSMALVLSPEEKRARNRSMRERVMRYDAQHWARTFINDLAASPAPDVVTAGANLSEARNEIVRALSENKRVALFLDYDGTLREIERDPPAAAPTPAVEALLRKLEGRPNLDVTLISGRQQEDLEAWFGVYGFNLIAEHGASVRRHGRPEWEQLDRNVSYAWKADLLPILRLYEEETPGSFVEEKRTSLVWHYRKADPQFGAWKARELAEELVALTANEPIQVRRGKKIVEVGAAEVNKGAAVARLLEYDQEYGIALCAGDDQTDESMFRLSTPRMLSIKVGDGPTQARFRIASPGAFRQFLEETLTPPQA
jgi:trehalose 6-phosphate synthase/phosphatase